MLTLGVEAGMADSVWRLSGGGVNIAVLADCHIHEGGPQFPAALFPRLQGADLIVTLGDMGEKAGLDQLQEIAPVLGVRGRDDVDDMRTRRDVLVLEQGRYHIAGTHEAEEAKFRPKGSALNPGSAVLPADDSFASFIRLKVSADGCYGQVIRLC